MTDRRLIFLTHAQVDIDPGTPVPEWGLSVQGKARHASFAESDEVAGVTSVYASTERKAIEGAEPVADRHGLTVRQVQALGENDRSATGYLPPEEFEEMADAFFANPDESIRGWESARAAQNRIVGAVQSIGLTDDNDGDILIVAHGAVGALLRCHLLGKAITRDEDQPHDGGCRFVTDTALTAKPGEWRRI